MRRSVCPAVVLVEACHTDGTSGTVQNITARRDMLLSCQIMGLPLFGLAAAFIDDQRSARSQQKCRCTYEAWKCQAVQSRSDKSRVNVQESWKMRAGGRCIVHRRCRSHGVVCGKSVFAFYESQLEGQPRQEGILTRRHILDPKVDRHGVCSKEQTAHHAKVPPHYIHSSTWV
ncbi:hypothetical protein F5883DRAFT_135129 [Diaporthe sp. PMI_573]|nr:hypothetical protein F5883DRAFT_135129 [Diaporthaceae sp. PMI_573]